MLTPAAFRRALRLTARNFADRTNLGRDALCIRFALPEVLYQLTNRIFFCVTFNYVLSWMTLRQGSIISAAPAHWVWNMLNIITRAGVPIFAGEREIHSLLLGVIGYLLLRFWPVTERPPATSAIQDAAPTPAS